MITDAVKPGEVKKEYDIGKDDLFTPDSLKMTRENNNFKITTIKPGL